jgi:hypothetical protein
MPVRPLLERTALDLFIERWASKLIRLPGTWWTAAVLAFLGFLLTARSEPGSAVVWNYLLLVGGSICLAAAISFHWFAGRFRWRLAGALTVCAVSVYAPFDGYENCWTKFDGSEKEIEGRPKDRKGARTEYRDSYWRRGRTPYYRYCNSYDKHECSITMQGPMAGQTKPHGEWTTILWKDDVRQTRNWRWYGETISEGEWHLRSARAGSAASGFLLALLAFALGCACYPLYRLAGRIGRASGSTSTPETAAVDRENPAAPIGGTCPRCRASVVMGELHCRRCQQPLAWTPPGPVSLR